MAINKDVFTHTFSGRLLNLRHFSKDDIDLRDIAVSLSRQRRYAGHTAVPWTVAQHITLCSAMADWMGCSDDDIKAVFLHDVEETWVQDVIFPIKRNFMFNDYKTLSRDVSNVVYEFFGLPGYLNDPDNKHFIDVFDQSAYVMEAFQMIPGFVHDQNLFHDDVNALVTELVNKEFSIPQGLIDHDELELAQDVFELLNVWAAERTIGAPISSELPDNVELVNGEYTVVREGK